MCRNSADPGCVDWGEGPGARLLGGEAGKVPSTPLGTERVLLRQERRWGSLGWHEPEPPLYRPQL